MTDQQSPELETFEISLRLLGNEIFAMQLSSKSAKKNWIIFGLLTLVLLSVLANQLSPALLALLTP